MKKIISLVLISMLLLLGVGYAESIDTSWLDAECPFEVRNGLKFGMSLEEVQTIEGVELVAGEKVYTYPETVELGGLEGYVIEYTFENNRLVKLEYLFEHPEKWSIEDVMTRLGADDFMSWMDNSGTLIEAMTAKYGECTNSVAGDDGMGSSWNVVYDNSLVGVDIEVMMDYDAYEYSDFGVFGTFTRNRVTYEAHNYQADIDAHNAEQEYIQNVADSL